MIENPILRDLGIKPAPPQIMLRNRKLEEPKPARRIRPVKQSCTSSPAIVNPVMDLILTSAMVGMIRDIRAARCTRNKTVFALIDRVISESSAAMKLFKGQFTATALKNCADRCVHFQKIYLKAHCDYVFTSFLLDVIEHRADRLRPDGKPLYTGKRKEAFERVLAAVRRLHKYFDRNGDKSIAEYNTAWIAAEAWRRGEK